MASRFELLNNFVLNAKPRIDFFWRTVSGRTDKQIWTLILFFLPFQMLIVGIGVLIERFKHHVPLYFIGFENISASLPTIFSASMNVCLWVSYFLLSLVIIISCYKPIMRKTNVLREQDSLILAKNFSPSETVVFSSLRISEELRKYAKAKIPSDLGLGGDLDWIEGLFYKVLTGKRPTGSYSGPNIDSNSFFAGLKDENDVIARLSLYEWYDEKDVKKDQIIYKLLKLREFVFKNGFWHEYSLGVDVFKFIAQTFLAANLKQKNAFKDNLNLTLEIYEKYSKTKAPLKGIPHYTVRFGPKIAIISIIVGILLACSILIIFILPKWIVSLSASKFNILLDVNTVKDVINIFFVLLSFISFFLVKIWKR